MKKETLFYISTVSKLKNLILDIYVPICLDLNWCVVISEDFDKKCPNVVYGWTVYTEESVWPDTNTLRMIGLIII